MYAKYYNLKKEPFHTTPDPEFLFQSPSHKEALTSIISGIEHRKGFIFITGEAGVGKTTIIRSFFETVDKQELKIIYLFNANISYQGLLRTIYQELGITAESDDSFDMVNQLHSFLIEEYKLGRNVVLFIDEAENLPMETLENLRMLDLETDGNKLIQIVLSGQPEFEQKFDCDELRQLKQRIAVKATILPLSLVESLDYIFHRLAKVSFNRTSIFTLEALEDIVMNADGIPRTINILCYNAFILALGRNQEQITSITVREIITSFTGRRNHTAVRWLIAAAVSLILLSGTIVIYHYKGPMVSFYPKAPDKVEKPDSARSHADTPSLTSILNGD